MHHRPLLLCLLPLIACPSEPTPDPGPPPIALTIPEHAEGTNPVHAMLPWPSDTWLVADPSTATGRRLEYDDLAVPRNRNGDFFDASPYRRLDGFSPASQPLMVFEQDLDMDNLPVEFEYDESLGADCPTLLINLDTGERVAHFVQDDRRVPELEPGSPVALVIHPAARLAEDAHYGVVFRDTIRSVEGAPLASWEAFAALRDGTITTSAALEARRPRYEQLFVAAEALGVPRAGILFGWTFHTASEDSITRDLLAMRDDAMERVPVGGGECVVEDVDVYQQEPCAAEDVGCEQNDEIRYRIYGTFRAPNYMEREYSPTLANRDPVTDLPTMLDWYDVRFTMMVPHAAYGGDAARFVTYGHGLMGGQSEVKGSFVRQMAANHNMIFAAADMQGMSEYDIVTVGQSLADMSGFVRVTERLMQGVTNWLVMTRSLQGGCRTMPELADYGAPTTLPMADEEPYYLGISQGAIMGMVYAAVSQDIRRAAVLVGGENYSVMIPRSSNFPDYEQIFLPWYPRRLDQEVLLSMIMSVWDKSEPSAFAPHIVTDPLRDTPSKGILHQVAVNDCQVPNLSSEVAARTMGIPLLTPTSKEVWGLPTVTAADQPEAAMVYFDFARPLGIDGNVPPPVDNDVHGDQRFLTAAQLQIDAFFHPDGVVQDFCAQDDGAGCSPE